MKWQSVMAIDPERDYTPDDVLTCDDALSLAVIGYKVRAVDMAEGTFVDYNFAGWRINHAAGASSGWSARTIDYAADWHVLPDEHYDAYKRVIMERDGIVERDKAEANTKWGRPTVAPDIQKLGRALRPVPSFEVPVGAVVRDWGAEARRRGRQPAARAPCGQMGQAG
jgi:hypothetical protein